MTKRTYPKTKYRFKYKAGRRLNVRDNHRHIQTAINVPNLIVLEITKEYRLPLRAAHAAFLRRLNTIYDNVIELETILIGGETTTGGNE